MTVIVPVAVVHVGCVTEVVGTEGCVGGAFMTAIVALDAQPKTVLFTLTLYVPAAKPLNVAAAW